MAKLTEEQKKSYLEEPAKCPFCKSENIEGQSMDFGSGQLDETGTLNLFSNLIKTGQAWSLQGSYGRTASRLIEAGWIDRSGKILKTPD
jgi:hypothetical protein